MQVFKDWLGLRRGEWRARLEKLPHFDLNDSDASDDKSPGGGQHSTSRGTHNLSMTGDMPIAQYSMDELLDMLDDALRSEDQTESVARLAVAIAHRAGAKRPRPSALAAVVAACRYLRRPHVHATPAHAATACGCNVRTCEQWVDRIEACLLAEASTEAAATAAPTEQGSSTSQAGEASVACSPDEISAVGGLVSLGDGQHRAGPSTDAPPPTLPLVDCVRV